MEGLGEIIRRLRKERKLPLRTVAAFLDIDQAILSKIERGQRPASREQVIRIAEFFRLEENELLVTWLSDKLLYVVAREDVGLKALQLAEEKVAYLTFTISDRKEILKKLKRTFKQFDKIKKAWVFGSFSRGDDGPKSDIDVAIETDLGFSYFDLAEVQHVLEKHTNRKIDVGFLDAFKPYILDRIRPDLKLIYESP